MRKKIIYSLLGCLLMGQQKLRSQMTITSEKTDTTIAANTVYNKAGSIRRFFYGDHYRKEWATPVDIQILDLETYAGGLTPVKLGGGLQTMSLRLEGADGKEYVLRSVNKDVSKALVEELRKTFAQDIVQDQVSSANPYAPMVVAGLAEAAGIYHSKPVMVYVEKSKHLGEFESKFGGTVCLLEERPSGNEGDNPAFGYSRKIINTQKLLENIFTNANHQVDEKAYLKARLFDMWIGDWDRHEDQWLWAAFSEDGKTFYKPIPRDRDQAFSKMDGLVPTLATRKWAVRKVQDFDYTIRDINGLNMSAGHLDRNFTTRLALEDWLKVAEELQDSLSDNAITKAFHEMPDAIYNLSGPGIIARLKHRRDDLQKYAKTYYQFLSEQVNITGTKESEYFRITRINNDSTQVTVYKAGEEERWNRAIYTRTFSRSETKEVRLYGLQGSDIYNLDGETKKGITIRVIGGEGNDDITDRSFVKGGKNKTKIYDDKNNNFYTGKESKRYISSDTLKNVYNRKAFKYDWVAPLFGPGYNVDEGFLANGGVIVKKQKFGKSPYASMQTIAGNYASSTQSYALLYKGYFKEFIGKADLQLEAKYNSPRYAYNYYGLGNETVIDETADKDYYRVRMSQFTFSPTMHRQLGKYHTLSFSTELQIYNLEETENRFVTTEDAKLDTSVFDRKKYGNIKLSYEFNTVDNALYPRKGVKIDMGGRFTKDLDANDKQFISLYSEAALYVSYGRLTLASRSGVATNTNDDYQFFQAHTLGGLNNLRGYHRERYSGKTSVYQNTELRFSISNMNAYFVKGVWGVLVFADHGRVWMPNEESNIWHHGYGGGLWFLPFNKMALTATYGVSKEDKLVSVKAGFLF
jgi:hypothetical protein